MDVSNYLISVIISAKDQFSGPLKGAFQNVTAETQKARTHVDGFGGSLVNIAAKFSIMAHAFRQAKNVFSFLASPLKTVEDFNMSIIKSAALLTSLTEAKSGETLADHFKRMTQYSEATLNAFVKIVPQVFGGLQELQLVNEELIKQGIILDINNTKQMSGFRNITNAAMVIAASYPNKEIQLRQEVRGLMEGQLRQSNQLANQLDAILGGRLKPMVEEWKRQGTVIENIGSLLSGYDAAAGKIQMTFDALKTTIKSTIQMTFWDSLQAAYKESVQLVSNFSDYIQENKGYIEAYLLIVWESLKSMAKAVNEFNKAIQKLTGDEGVFYTFMESFGYFAIAIIPAALKAWSTFVTDIFNGASVIEQKWKETKEWFKNPFSEASKNAKAESEKAWNWFIKTIQDENKEVDDLLIKGMDTVNKIMARASTVKAVAAPFGIEAPKSKPQPTESKESIKEREKILDDIAKLERKYERDIFAEFRRTYEERYKIVEKDAQGIAALNKWAALESSQIWNDYYLDIAQKEKQNLVAGQDDLAHKLDIISKEVEIRQLKGEESYLIEKYWEEATTDVILKETKKRTTDYEKERNRAEAQRISEGKAYIESIYSLDSFGKSMAERLDDEHKGALETGKMYDYLVSKSGKYYSEAVQGIDDKLNAEKFAIEQASESYVDQFVLEDYLTERRKELVLELRDANLHSIDDMAEGWKVAHEQMLLQSKSFAEISKALYNGVFQALQQTFSDFFFDAFTNQLKTAGDYFRSFTQSIARTWSDLMSQIITKWLMMKAITMIGSWFSGSYSNAGTTGGVPNSEFGLSSHNGGYQMGSMDNGGLVRKVQAGEYIIRKPSVNSETLPALQSINDTGRSGGDQQPVQITNVIYALDAQSFDTYLRRNAGVLDANMTSIYDKNGAFRKRLGGR